MKTIIIAEAGVNHNGDINLAKRLIDVAKECGADLVKFQLYDSNNLATKDAAKAEYQVLVTDSSESQREMLSKLELTEDMMKELILYAKSKGIDIFATGFDIKSVNTLINLGQDRFKIPSGEITNLPLLRHVGRLNKQIIISTGMCELNEVAYALETLITSGTPKEKITILHCTSAYPAPVSDINLNAMQAMQKIFDISIGYSDHSLGIEVAIAAVALGASVIEKHFTIDRNLPGPDHKASLKPSELKSMIASIRNIEEAMGNGIKRVMPSEISNLVASRKSIVANVSIKKGEVFTFDNLTTKRPGVGVSPIKIDEIIGTKSVRDYAADELIQL
jgi:N,N'-diacetyllegionaminate synthase